MKKVLLMVAIMSLSVVSMAQSNQEDVDFIQALFGMEKKAFIAEFIQVDGVEGEAFWTLYDEYEVNRKELGKLRIELLETYAANYDSMNDVMAEAILKDMIMLQTNTDKMISSYANKIKKKVNVKTAAQFYQIEGYIVSKIRSEILENIPVIGGM